MQKALSLDILKTLSECTCIIPLYWSKYHDVKMATLIMSSDRRKRKNLIFYIKMTLQYFGKILETMLNITRDNWINMLLRYKIVMRYSWISFYWLLWLINEKQFQSFLLNCVIILFHYRKQRNRQNLTIRGIARTI